MRGAPRGASKRVRSKPAGAQQARVLTASKGTPSKRASKRAGRARLWDVVVLRQVCEVLIKVLHAVAVALLRKAPQPLLLEARHLLVAAALRLGALVLLVAGRRRDKALERRRLRGGGGAAAAVAVGRLLVARL